MDRNLPTQIIVRRLFFFAERCNFFINPDTYTHIFKQKENSMKKYKIITGILAFSLISFLLMDGCRKPENLQSKWLGREIVIDGNDSDWRDYSFFYDDKTRSCIGVYNDDANLYLCLQTMDENIQRQILTRGLFVWFNRTGGNNKELGICFPTARRLTGPGDFPGRPSGMHGTPLERQPDMSGLHAGMASGDRKMPPGQPQGRVPDVIEEIRLFTSDKDEGWPYTLQEAANLGIFTRYTLDQRKRFIYELKIHLAQGAEFVYGAVTSEANTIGIGFTTTRSTDRSLSGGMGRGDMGRGGMGRENMPVDNFSGEGMGGRGMSGGGRPGGDMGRSEDSLDVWINVTLAANPINSN